MHTTNYTDTLILPSPDCRAEVSLAPGKPGSIATLQHQFLLEAPYRLTSDDLLVAVTASRRGLDKDDHAALRAELFAKGQPCLRASPLVKSLGWAIHHDSAGKVSLVAQHSPRMAALLADPAVAKTPGMRSAKAG
jgi:hypothetical protein